MSNKDVLAEQLIVAVKKEQVVNVTRAAQDHEVEGRTASYPVDLFWEFDASNGIHYQVIFDMQHMDKAIERNDLFHFANLLQDISGQVMGVMFTQPVYDKLVKDVARDVGIVLYEMTGANDEPVWEPEILNPKIDVDQEWAQEEKAKFGLENEKIPYGGQFHEMFIYDEDGFCLDSLQGIFSDAVREQRANKCFDKTGYSRIFTDKKVYLKTDHELIPMVKINGISFDVIFNNIAKVEADEISHKIVEAALRAQLK